MGWKIPDVNLEIPNSSSQIYPEIWKQSNSKSQQVLLCEELTELILKFMLKWEQPTWARVILKNKIADPPQLDSPAV